jgi:hypothetical protein
MKYWLEFRNRGRSQVAQRLNTVLILADSSKISGRKLTISAAACEEKMVTAYVKIVIDK